MEIILDNKKKVSSSKSEKDANDNQIMNSIWDFQCFALLVKIEPNYILKSVNSQFT